MKLSDFKVGQPVFVMGDGHTQKTRFQVNEATVVKVGRKYVTISGSWGLQFGVFSEGLPYLSEKTDVGTPRRLFPSKEAVDEFCEREQLKAWACAAIDWTKVDRLSTAQLRDMKRILERGGETGKRVYAKTTMEAMPGSCTECAFGRRYGCVGDVECRVLRKYFTGNVEPPYKERPDECPLVEMAAEPTH